MLRQGAEGGGTRGTDPSDCAAASCSRATAAAKEALRGRSWAVTMLLTFTDTLHRQHMA